MARLGDLIVAVFDEAARYSTDPREISRLATRAVRQLMRAPRTISVPPQPATYIDVPLTMAGIVRFVGHGTPAERSYRAASTSIDSSKRSFKGNGGR